MYTGSNKLRFLWIFGFLVGIFYYFIFIWIAILKHRTAIHGEFEPVKLLVLFAWNTWPYFLLAFISSIWVRKKPATANLQRALVAACIGFIVNEFAWKELFYRIVVPQGVGADLGIGIWIIATPYFCRNCNVVWFFYLQ